MKLIKDLFKKKDESTQVLTETKVEKKKPSKKLQLVIGICIVLYLGMEYLLPLMDKTPKDAVTSQSINSKQESPNVDNPEKVNESPKTEVPVENIEPPSETTPIAETQAASDVIPNVTLDRTEESEPSTESATIPSEVTTEIPTEAITETVTDAEPVDSSPVATPTEEPTATTGVNQTEDTISADSEVTPSLEEATEKNINVQLEKIIEKVNTESLEKTEYKHLPNFESTGRGLVYNCKGRHWACLDKDQYNQCFENMKWAKGNQKKLECVTQNIYATDDDCVTVQTYNINMIVDTKFCDE